MVSHPWCRVLPPPQGSAAGALIASALVQYGPAPTHLVWWLLLAAFVIGIPAVLKMPETGTMRPGALKSLRPDIAVPREARGAFVVAAPCLIGVWALGGFYLSLGPSLAEQLARSQNLLWGGVSIFLLTGLGSGVSVKLRNSDPPLVMLSGSVMLVIGALVTFGAILSGSAAVLLIGTALAGLGFGPAFLGAYRTVVAFAPPDDRAALVSAIYIVSNLAFGISSPDRRGDDDVLRSAPDCACLFVGSRRTRRPRGRQLPAAAQAVAVNGDLFTASAWKARAVRKGGPRHVPIAPRGGKATCSHNGYKTQGGFKMSSAVPQAQGLMRADIQEHNLSVPGREVIQNRVDISPDAPALRHRHPGEEVVYVLEGSLEYQIDGQPPKRVSAG